MAGKTSEYVPILLAAALWACIVPIIRLSSSDTHGYLLKDECSEGLASLVLGNGICLRVDLGARQVANGLARAECNGGERLEYGGAVAGTGPKQKTTT